VGHAGDAEREELGAHHAGPDRRILRHDPPGGFGRVGPKDHDPEGGGVRGLGASEQKHGPDLRQPLEIRDVLRDGGALGGRQAVGQHDRTRRLEPVEKPALGPIACSCPSAGDRPAGRRPSVARDRSGR